MAWAPRALYGVFTWVKVPVPVSGPQPSTARLPSLSVSELQEVALRMLTYVNKDDKNRVIHQRSVLLSDLAPCTCRHTKHTGK